MMDTLTLVVRTPFGWVDKDADLSEGEAVLLGFKQIQRFAPSDVMGPNLNGTYAVRKPCECCSHE